MRPADVKKGRLANVFVALAPTDADTAVAAYVRTTAAVSEGVHGRFEATEAMDERGDGHPIVRVVFPSLTIGSTTAATPNVFYCSLPVAAKRTGTVLDGGRTAGLLVATGAATDGSPRTDSDDALAATTAVASPDAARTAAVVNHGGALFTMDVAASPDGLLSALQQQRAGVQDARCAVVGGADQRAAATVASLAAGLNKCIQWSSLRPMHSNYRRKVVANDAASKRKRGTAEEDERRDDVVFFRSDA